MSKHTSIAMALAAVLSAPGLAHAHGTEDPGPHGGEIRMPGAFHVEAVTRDEAVVLYLLDMQFEQPRVADSSVDATLRQNGKRMELNCRVADKAKAFRCPVPEGATLERGTLVVDASRKGMPADAAQYDLPLAWNDQQGSAN